MFEFDLPNPKPHVRVDGENQPNMCATPYASSHVICTQLYTYTHTCVCTHTYTPPHTHTHDLQITRCLVEDKFFPLSFLIRNSWPSVTSDMVGFELNPPCCTSSSLWFLSDRKVGSALWVNLQHPCPFSLCPFRRTLPSAEHHLQDSHFTDHGDEKSG